MRRLLLTALVCCVATTMVHAQTFQYAGDGAVTGTKALTDDYLYLESDDSGYFITTTAGHTYGDDIHFNSPVTMTGWEFEYFSRVTAAFVPFNGFVTFHEMDSYSGAAGAVLASYTLTGLTTGGHVIEQDFPGAPVALPEHVYMEIGWDAAVRGDTGIKIALDDTAEVGVSSWDLFPVFNPPGSYLGLSWWGGYTPDIPAGGAGWNPMGNFVIGIAGVPEPLTLGLVALGGLVALRRRR
jgi:hypothetical protein